MDCIKAPNSSDKATEILFIGSKTIWTPGSDNSRYYLLYGYNLLSTLSLLFLNFTQSWKKGILAPTSNSFH